jgi:hypothetical protein
MVCVRTMRLTKQQYRQQDSPGNGANAFNRYRLNARRTLPINTPDRAAARGPHRLRTLDARPRVDFLGARGFGFADETIKLDGALNLGRPS